MSARDSDPDLVRLISEPRRREILGLVWSTELSAREIASHFDVTFSAISQHLKILADAKLVDVRRDGRFRIYRANRKAFTRAEQQMLEFWLGKLNSVAAAAEAEWRRKKRL